MAGKEYTTDPMEGPEFDGEVGGGFEVESDFNVEDEYKPTPLVPVGTYHANVLNVGFNAEEQTIVWTICLEGNGGVMSDGETELDGVQLTYKNWLPKIGDENILTKSGKSTKRQAKINMLADFAKSMKIDMNTSAVIRDALLNGEWIGLSVSAQVGIREYEGRVYNEVKKLVAG